jgi:hypothetical protein
MLKTNMCHYYMEEFKKKVEEIVESDIHNKWCHFSEKYPDFFEHYPKLMAMACETQDKYSFYERFDYFMKMKQAIDTNNVTTDQADIVIGEHLAQTYLPKIKK